MKTYLGLGSNIGNRRSSIYRAISLLTLEKGVRLEQLSPLYETSHVGTGKQRGYINCAIRIDTGLKPRALLSRLKAIEKKLGRVKHGGLPRTIDLDILFYGGRIVREPGLAVPHAGLHRRKFALVPMLSLAPGLRHPVLGKTIRELNSGLKDKTQKIRKMQ